MEAEKKSNKHLANRGKDCDKCFIGREKGYNFCPYCGKQLKIPPIILDYNS